MLELRNRENIGLLGSSCHLVAVSKHVPLKALGWLKNEVSYMGKFSCSVLHFCTPCRTPRKICTTLQPQKQAFIQQRRASIALSQLPQLGSPCKCHQRDRGCNLSTSHVRWFCASMELGMYDTFSKLLNILLHWYSWRNLMPMHVLKF